MSQNDIRETNDEINVQSVKNKVEMSKVDMRQINAGALKSQKKCVRNTCKNLIE